VHHARVAPQSIAGEDESTASSLAACDIVKIAPGLPGFYGESALYNSRLVM
jgi:hypothetical protein